MTKHCYTSDPQKIKYLDKLKILTHEMQLLVAHLLQPAMQERSNITTVQKYITNERSYQVQGAEVYPVPPIP